MNGPLLTALSLLLAAALAGGRLGRPSGAVRRRKSPSPGQRRWFAGALVAALMIVISAVASAPAGSARPRTATAFAVALPAPDPGDVSFGVARVRIVPGSPGLRHPGLMGGRRVFVGLVGGLRVTARSSSGRLLHAGTRVYLVVSRVAGADASERDVAFFIVRRRVAGARSSSPGAEFEFSITNAVAATGSFWVKGIDSRGLARIFAVRNLLATAVANWGRYQRVLRAARALTAAARPFVLSRPAARAAGVRRPGRGPAIWTGGQRPSRRVRAVFRLLVDALADPLQFAAVKRNPLIVEFIAHELGNPRLAGRWRRVTTRLPLKVPDRYAAAAQEEARFTPVRAPLITHARVAIDDPTNSADLFWQDLEKYATTLTVTVGGQGAVSGQTFVYGHNLDCPRPDGHDCTARFLTGAIWETLTARPAAGWYFAGFQGCDQIQADTCRVLAGDTNRTVTVLFNQPATLYITNGGNSPGSVEAADCGRAFSNGTFKDACQPQPDVLQCSQLAEFGGTCSKQFSVGTTLELLAEPYYDTAAWGAGCDKTDGLVCEVKIGLGGNRVTVKFDASNGLTVSKVPVGGGSGRVTSSPPGIDCGPQCTGFFDVGGLVQLKALPDPGSVFAGWSGNDGCASAPQRPTCTVDVSSIPQSVTATFAAVSGPPPTASFTITPNPSPFGQPVSFDASGSWAADGDQITDYRWDFGDSNTGDAGADPVTAHSYQCSGPVQVTLTVTTANGQQGTQRQPLTIAQGRPVCAGIIRLAGDGHVCPGPSACGDGGQAASAELGFPAGVAVDSAGDVYIADTSDQKIRKISASDGTITTIAGDGSTCVTATCGDGGAATRAELFNPSSVALDAAGDIYIADTSDQEIRRVSTDGTITTIAGIHGVPCELAPGCGDGGPATRAQLDQPLGVAVDSAGNVYIADAGDNELRKIAAATGTITRIAGTGTPCPSAPDCGDGGSPTTVELNDPEGVAVDPSGNVYIADTGDNEIRELTTDGRIARIAGTGHRCLTAPTCGDGGRATDALLNSPAGVAVDPSGGAVYVADTGDDTARYFFPGHEISLFAGNGTPCTTAPACGDGGQATSAQLRFPQGIAVDSFHNVDIADTQNHEIRQAR